MREPKPAVETQRWAVCKRDGAGIGVKLLPAMPALIVISPSTPHGCSGETRVDDGIGSTTEGKGASTLSEALGATGSGPMIWPRSFLPRTLAVTGDDFSWSSLDSLCSRHTCPSCKNQPAGESLMCRNSLLETRSPVETLQENCTYSDLSNDSEALDGAVLDEVVNFC